MSILRSLIPAPKRSVMRASAGQPLPLDDWVSMFNWWNYPYLANSPYTGNEERIADNFSGLVQGAYKSNGIVFACEVARLMLFNQARFQFRQFRGGRPGDYFGTEALRILEEPWPGGTTGDLLNKALLHADFGGTGFVVRRRKRTGDRLRNPRPDWITMVLGSDDDPDMTGEHIDAELVGLLYHPGGRNSGNEPIALLPEDVAVFAPIPDPMGHFRGVPWMSAITREIMADGAATAHKLKFFENGATPQIIVSLDASITDPVKFRAWLEVLEQDHSGVANAYKTLYLGAGAQATVVGSDLKQLDFKATQGAGETRIAAAARVPAVVAGISEGLQGSSLNAGNFAESMHEFADLFARPAWQNFAGSIARIVPPPSGSGVWYDDRDIPALKEDIKDAAEVTSKHVTAIRTLWDGGAEPQSAIDAVVSGDLRRLNHTGQLSVQLQAPGTVAQPRQVAARETFWITSGPATGLHVEAGTVVDPAHPVAVAFAEMFAPVEGAPVVIEGRSTPLLASGDGEWVYCTGTREGQPCKAKVGRRASTEPVGFEVKCHQCGTLVAA